MIVVTSKTGWTEEFVRWELPLWRGQAYYHVARALEGERFRWPGGENRVSRWIRRVREWVRGRKRMVES